MSGEETFDIVGVDSLVKGAGETFAVWANGLDPPVVAGLDNQSQRDQCRQGESLPFLLRPLAGT